MSWARRVVRIALLSALGACGRRDRPPPDRPSRPTLSIAPAADAPTTARRIVATGQIQQPWHTGLWSPASITLTDVAAGDAIVVLGLYWGDLVAGSNTSPTDDRGNLRAVADQGSTTVGRQKPPVFAQLYVDFAPAAGPHTIVPPYLGGPAGDGTLYVVQVRGLTEHRVVASSHSRIVGTAIGGVSITANGTAGSAGSGTANGAASGAAISTSTSTSTSTDAGSATGAPSSTTPSAAAVAPDDLVIALGGYDNTTGREAPGWAAPPIGWAVLGVQNDASDNVPSQLRARTTSTSGTSATDPAQPPAATWVWSDPTVNVAAAVIAALR